MEFKSYQVVYAADGTVESITELPEEPEKKRMFVVRAENEVKADMLAKRLYSLAK